MAPLLQMSDGVRRMTNGAPLGGSKRGVSRPSLVTAPVGRRSLCRSCSSGSSQEPTWYRTARPTGARTTPTATASRGQPRPSRVRLPPAKPCLSSAQCNRPPPSPTGTLSARAHPRRRACMPTCRVACTALRGHRPRAPEQGARCSLPPASHAAGGRAPRARRTSPATHHDSADRRSAPVVGSPRLGPAERIRRRRVGPPWLSSA